jgi:hypothetical protein
MTRRSDKQAATAFMVPDKQVGALWAVIDNDWECSAEGTHVVALFDNEQIARQFADAREYPSVRCLSVYHAMKRYN